MRLADVATICVALLTFVLLEPSASARIQPKELSGRVDHILQTVDEKGNAHGITMGDMFNMVKSFTAEEIAPSRPNLQSRSHSASAGLIYSSSGHTVRILWWSIAPVVLLAALTYITRYHFKMQLCGICCALRREKRHQYKYKGRLIYEWNQTSSSVSFYIRLPEGITKRMIEVKIWPRHVKIGRSGKVAFLREELFGLVDDAASSWDVTASGELAVTLQKEESEDWPSLFLHHPHADRKCEEIDRSCLKEIREVASHCQSDEN